VPAAHLVGAGRARLVRSSCSLTRTAVRHRTFDSQPKRISHPSARRTIDFTLTIDFAHKLSDPLRVLSIEFDSHRIIVVVEWAGKGGIWQIIHGDMRHRE